jgi:hypothetical protein
MTRLDETDDDYVCTASPFVRLLGRYHLHVARTIEAFWSPTITVENGFSKLLVCCLKWIAVEGFSILTCGGRTSPSKLDFLLFFEAVGAVTVNGRSHKFRPVVLVA